MRIPITPDLISILTATFAIVNAVSAQPLDEPWEIAARSNPDVYTYGGAVASSDYHKKKEFNIFLIRHGEKPADDNDPNLSAAGEKRAQCIAGLFSSYPYDIGKIVAQTPKKSGKRSRPMKTVQPLANTLDMKIDTSCDRDDPKCVKKLVDGWSGEGDILICWEHKKLTDILEALGIKPAPNYPKDRFDLIWKVEDGKLVGEASEHCAGLDGARYVP